MPTFKHPWRVRISTWIRLPTTRFHMGSPCCLPSMSKLFVIHYAPAHSIIKSPSELGEQTASPHLLGLCWPLPRVENLPALNSQGALPEILMGYFSLHTLFCLYFYLCLISLKRSGNCFFVDFAQCWVYKPSWVLSEADFEDWAVSFGLFRRLAVCLECPSQKLSLFLYWINKCLYSQDHQSVKWITIWHWISMQQI